MQVLEFTKRNLNTFLYTPVISESQYQIEAATFGDLMVMRDRVLQSPVYTEAVSVHAYQLHTATHSLS